MIYFYFSAFGVYTINGQILDTTSVSIKVVAGKNLVLPCHVENIGTYKVNYGNINTGMPGNTLSSLASL